MLSKIKSNTEARMSLAENGSQSASNNDNNNNNNNNNNDDDDEEEEEDIESTNQDSNNNNSNNSHKSLQPPAREIKRSEEELLDIVEVSRERRLSKDSADSLGNFIRWSFGHRQRSITNLENEQVEDDEEDEETEMVASEDDDAQDDDWSAATSRGQQRQQRHNRSFSALNKFQLAQDQAQLMLRQQAKQFSPTSGATNLTLVKNEKLSSNINNNNNNLSSDVASSRGIKRARTYLVDSPSPTNAAPARKTSSYLGNVVERLHQQQQQQLQQQQQQQLQKRQEIDQESGLNASLSQHLQRFLQQQTSLEDLCSQVGIDDNNQLVLAAAIHRALVDSAPPNASSIDNKSTASSTGSSSAGSSSNNNNNNSSLNLSRIQQASLNTSGANLSLVDPMNRQRRVYNTRAAMHGAIGSHHHHNHNNHHQHQPSATATTTAPASLAASIASQQQQVNASQPSSLGGRVHAQHQQQRHAQAAAALSALASVGSHLAAVVNPHNHHHNNHHHNQFSAAAVAAAASAAAGGGPMISGGLGVDFECDTCGSSFDDRHRLMQHQSIHLELKKDWFTETPVDEVMKIFNRRRGEFLCNICNLRFEATLDYDQHNHQVHGPRPYCCQFCGNGTRTFKCWRQYLNHLYDHRYIFGCTIDDCDFTVNRRDSLRFHIFRFHLNCQLPQNQQTQPLRVNQHHPPLGANLQHANSLANSSRKWAHGLPAARSGAGGMDDDLVDDLVRGEGDDLVNDEINVAD